MGDRLRSPKLLGKNRGSSGDFCCVPGCSNSRGSCKRVGKQVSFYKFPSDEKRKQLWLKRIRRNVEFIYRDLANPSTTRVEIIPFEPSKTSTVCSEHFVGGKKVDFSDHPAYVPSIFPRNKTVPRSTQSAKKAEYDTPSPNDLAATQRKKRSSSFSEVPLPGRPRRRLSFSANSVWNTTDHDYIRTNYEISTSEYDDSDQTTVIENLKQENESLKSKLLRLENVKDDDGQFQFYTNLPNYHVFTALVDYLKTRCDGNLKYWRGGETNMTESGTGAKGPTRKFTFEEELFLVLVKLKTGNFNEDLARSFDTSVAHISRVFSTWINCLCVELKLLFEMQSSDNEIAECYEAYSNLKVVLDCTELYIQRANNLDARKKTFSNYKHHDTVKFLVGLSPNLAVNYVSRAWGGRASDKHITLSSEGFWDGLSPGQTVMADRGFNIAHDLKKRGVKLVIPEFKGRDRPQLTQQEAAHSEYVAKARIHIERIIQRIKTFSFLERIIRLNMVDIIEQIFIVCAYLTNFQLPIVKRKN